MYYFFLMYCNEENANLTELSIYFNIRKAIDQSKKNYFWVHFSLVDICASPFYQMMYLLMNMQLHYSCHELQLGHQFIYTFEYIHPKRIAMILKIFM